MVDDLTKRKNNNYLNSAHPIILQAKTTKKSSPHNSTYFILFKGEGVAPLSTVVCPFNVGNVQFVS